MGKKKDSHPEPRDLVLYKNTDLYPTGAEGPGISFYQELYKYKSVQDYLDQQKKKRKKRKAKLRKKAFYIIAFGDINNLDFPTDSQTTPIPTAPDFSGANQIGGIADHVTPSADFIGQDVGLNLNYGVSKDYPPTSPPDADFWNRLIDALSGGFSNLEENKKEINTSLSPAEPSIQGIPDGMISKEDQDHIYTNTGYGITDSGNKSYDGVPFPTNKY